MRRKKTTVKGLPKQKSTGNIFDPQVDNSDFRAVRHAVWVEWRRLADDKEFIWETARLRFHLGLALIDHPGKINFYFDPLFAPTPSQVAEVYQQLGQIRDKPLRKLLRRYLAYVSRFGVSMRLHKDKPHFRVGMVRTDPATKFDVAVVGNHFEPFAGWNDGETPPSDFFGSDLTAVGPKMQELIRSRTAKFVAIKDRTKHSLLRQLVDFSYFHDRLTFCVLNLERPYVFCLVGENVSVDKTWRKAGEVVTELQKLHYGRTKAGRPTDMGKLKNNLAVLLRKGDPLKEKAIELAKSGTAKEVYSKMSALSQMMRKLKL